MRFTKMHGAGNSFILLDALHGELQGEDLSVLALRLCRGETGHGADGMIVLVPAAEADLGMLFYNADGSTGEMCGNGARCLARYALEHGPHTQMVEAEQVAPDGVVEPVNGQSDGEKE